MIEGENLQYKVEVGHVCDPADTQLTRTVLIGRLQFFPYLSRPLPPIGDAAYELIPFSPVRVTQLDVVLE